jgi:hypothetical protein
MSRRMPQLPHNRLAHAQSSSLDEAAAGMAELHARAPPRCGAQSPHVPLQ